MAAEVLSPQSSSPEKKDSISSRSEEAVSASISATHAGELDKIHCHRWPSKELIKGLSIISINNTDGRFPQRSYFTPVAHLEKLVVYNPC